MSELHNRLAHLVNYSSQLIFVSGDSVADQQRTLNDFLSQQQEDTEVSFFSATADKNPSDYRGMICRQLGGHTVGSFVRPLNQLLIDLPSDNGPFLVCITQAEYLDKPFLQELWDWVMHAQQYNKRLHLNIILFGRSDWAQESQEWLPSQNSHKPVLLSSHCVNPVGFDVNALEALMAQDNKWFTTSSGPIVTKKWFITGVLSIFLCVFVGMLTWQYPEQIKGLLAGELPQNTDLPAFNISEADINKPIIAEQLALSDDDNLNNASIKPKFESDYQAQIEVINPNSAANNIPRLALNTLTQDKPSAADALLVSNWNNRATNTDIDLGSPSLASQVLPNNLTPNPSETAKSDNNKQDRIYASADEFDFQVPDIISVEQLDATLQANSKISTQALLEVDEDTTGQLTDQKLNEITQNSPESLISAISSIDYKFDETTLLALPTDAIVLQLSGIQNPVVLENYLNSNNLKANTWVYETQRYGGPWYVVVYRQSFDSIDAALNRLSSLPDDVRNAQPFAKSINQIQREIQQR